MDWHKLQHKLFALDPTDPREDLAKLQRAAQGRASGDIAPAKDYLRESVEVPEGSLGLDRNYSVSDFAALAGVKVSEKVDNPFAPDALEKGVKDWAKRTFDPSGMSAAKEPTVKKQQVSVNSVKGIHPRLAAKLVPFVPALEKIFTSERELKKEFLDLMKRADPNTESVEEADVMKFTAPNTVKQRDPNWRDMEALRKSGAAGAHKDKKKDAKSGKVKHKSKEYESIKDMLYAKLNEKK